MKLKVDGEADALYLRLDDSPIVESEAMTITKQTVADKIAAYLHHQITLAQLVDWSERAMM